MSNYVINKTSPTLAQFTVVDVGEAKAATSCTKLCCLAEDQPGEEQESGHHSG